MKEFVNQAVSIFNEYEKWSSFIDMTEIYGQVRIKFYEKFRAAMIKRFGSEEANNTWSFISSNFFEYQWYLTKFNNQSVSLWLEYEDFTFSLWVNSNLFNHSKACELLKTDEYKPLRQCFQNPFSSFTDGSYFIREKFTTSIIDPSLRPDNYDSNRHAWYLYYQTEQVVENIAKRVSMFQTPEISDLLFKLNSEVCK